MEFNWIDAPFDLKKLTPKEIEESFEDPFAVKLQPELDAQEGRVRYFLLGKSLNNRPIFSVFRTDGNNYRVICSREMTEKEINFYERKNAEYNT